MKGRLHNSNFLTQGAGVHADPELPCKSRLAETMDNVLSVMNKHGFPVRLRAIGGLVFLLLYLGGCASLPDDLEQVPSQGWSTPEETLLGGLIAETAPADKSLSGVELLADPTEAFSTRFAIAAFA